MKSQSSYRHAQQRPALQTIQNSAPQILLTMFASTHACLIYTGIGSSHVTLLCVTLREVGGK